MNQLININESFTLSFYVENRQKDLHISIINKLTANLVSVYPYGDHMHEFRVNVKNVRDAVSLADNIGNSFAMIGEINRDWNMGLITRKEYMERLSLHLSDHVLGNIN